MALMWASLQDARWFRSWGLRREPKAPGLEAQDRFVGNGAGAAYWTSELRGGRGSGVAGSGLRGAPSGSGAGAPAPATPTRPGSRLLPRSAAPPRRGAPEWPGSAREKALELRPGSRAPLP